MKHIRILSPSGAIDSTYIETACERLRAWGYETSVAAHACDRHGRFAATDDERVQDWQQAIADDSVDIILCARGGYGLQRIIDRLCPTDKLVIGFSDITELHQLQSLNGQPSLHGLMCKHVATLPEDADPLVQWHKVLEGEDLHYSIPAHKLNREGQAEGVLIGGNLSVLYGLQDTPYSLKAVMEKYPSTILFIEDIAERHYHIDRMMNNLRMSGVLAKIKGLIVGQFSDCEDDAGMGETIYETIRRAVEGYDYPVLFDFPAGHVENNLPLLLGSNGRLTISHLGADWAESRTCK